MNLQDLVEQLQGHTIVTQSDPEGAFGLYFVAWNGSCTYRIFHIYNYGESVEEVDVWTANMEYPIDSPSQRERYAQEYLNKWMTR